MGAPAPSNFPLVKQMINRPSANCGGKIAGQVRHDLSSVFQ